MSNPTDKVLMVPQSLKGIVTQEEYQDMVNGLFPAIRKVNIIGILYILSSLMAETADVLSHEERDSIKQFWLSYNKTSSALIAEVADEMREMQSHNPAVISEFFEDILSF